MNTEKKFKTNQKQNKRITGNIHSTQKRKKQTVKHIRTMLVLRSCQLELRICSTSDILNVYSIVFHYEVSPTNFTAA